MTTDPAKLPRPCPIEFIASTTSGTGADASTVTSKLGPQHSELCLKRDLNFGSKFINCYCAFGNRFLPPLQISSIANYWRQHLFSIIDWTMSFHRCRRRGQLIGANQLKRGIMSASGGPNVTYNECTWCVVVDVYVFLTRYNHCPCCQI